ncbi:unnamed protein product [Schistocephalus solidus]|uniref:Phosphatidylinositol-4,5-bisphosphate 4-phosphatase n=1 Tax=Schistocephalus solidus TaxID=70667 RepID=A0A3P7EQL8_SCHSO|nr:unnamed protein product [Schistocephalus solidus]
MENVPINGGTFTQRNVAIRLHCGNCQRPFSIPSPQNSYPHTRTCADRLIYCLSGGSAPNSNFLIAARCPQCRKVTSVGPAYARVRWVSYLLLTLIFLIISIAVTIGTVYAALTNGALYFLWSEQLPVGNYYSCCNLEEEGMVAFIDFRSRFCVAELSSTSVIQSKFSKLHTLRLGFQLTRLST